MAAPVIVTGSFVWHELLTTDTSAAERFYKDVVGWGAAPFEGGPGPYTVFNAGEAPAAGLMTLPDEARQAGAQPHWLAYVSVANADETVTQAQQLGATVLMGPMSMPNVGRFAVLKDPQGAVFAVIAAEGDQPAEDDPKPLGFSWHELATTDPKAAWKFYSALFGWSERDTMESPQGPYQMFGRDRFMYGGIYEKPAEMPAPSAWTHYAMVQDSADAAAERATKAGGQVLVPPMEVPGGDRIAVLMDPQGAVFAVHSKGK